MLLFLSHKVDISPFSTAIFSMPGPDFVAIANWFYTYLNFMHSIHKLILCMHIYNKRLCLQVFFKNMTKTDLYK